MENVIYKPSDRNCIEILSKHEFMLKVETNEKVYETKYGNKTIIAEKYIKRLTLTSTEIKIELENIFLYDILIDLTY